MNFNEILHFKIGRWQTKNHSDNKHEDDFHKPDGVKQQILNQVGKRNYEHKVGTNPDIQIDKKGKIVLVGSRKGKYKYAKPFITEIRADDFFILRFVPDSEKQFLDIYLYSNESESEKKKSEKEEIQDLFETNEFVILPNDENLILQFLEYAYDRQQTFENEVNILIIIN
ncbi:hypothetical protein [Flavobacterium foetidum]|uniref:hypothetical protein n=1 Tax=Flavobacterium foetidum TaxID=2026681 RepID=UPI0010756480|nr:hypothetical protein [Flavobacterium foetidum]KAF2516452.1 hypothetical protein E0W73_05005 [Flavobacterium foetidum]